jgi:hypothetical protein
MCVRILKQAVLSSIKSVCWYKHGETRGWSLTNPRDIEKSARFWDITQRRTVIVYATFWEIHSCTNAAMSTVQLMVPLNSTTL